MRKKCFMNVPVFANVTFFSKKIMEMNVVNTSCYLREKCFKLYSTNAIIALIHTLIVINPCKVYEHMQTHRLHKIQMVDSRVNRSMITKMDWGDKNELYYYTCMNFRTIRIIILQNWLIEGSWRIIYPCRIDRCPSIFDGLGLALPGIRAMYRMTYALL